MQVQNFTRYTAPDGYATLIGEYLPSGETRWHWQGPRYRPVMLSLASHFLSLLPPQEGKPRQADPRQVFGLRPTGELSLMGDEYARATGWYYASWLYYRTRSRWRSWRIAGWRWLFARLILCGWLDASRVQCNQVQSGWAVLRQGFSPCWPPRWRGLDYSAPQVEPVGTYVGQDGFTGEGRE